MDRQFTKSSWFMIIYTMCFIQTAVSDPEHSRHKRGWIETLCKSFSISATRQNWRSVYVNITFDDACETVPRSAFPVRFFFTLSSTGNNKGQKINPSSVYISPMYCSCKKPKCYRKYGSLKLNNKIYFLKIEPRCSGYGPGIDACNVCDPIELILPYSSKPSVTIYDSKQQLKMTENPVDRDGEISTWLIVVAIVGPAILAVILVILLICLCKTSKKAPKGQDLPMPNGDLFEEVPLKRKRILLITHSIRHYRKNEIFLKVLRKFDDLNIINIEECFGELQSDYHNWVQNEVLRCDVVILVLSRDLNEIVSCNNKLLDEQFTNDDIAPILYELVNFCQAVNVSKYVTTFEDNIDYSEKFFEKYPSFNTGAIFNLSDLKEDDDVTFSHTVPDLFHLLSAIYSDIIPERLEAQGYISQTLDTDSDIEIQCLHTEV